MLIWYNRFNIDKISKKIKVRFSLLNAQITALVDNIEKVIIGKRTVILHMISALLAQGHVLIEDIPGVGKTQLVSALSRSVNGRFHRVQMTPDIMPSDIVGYTMIHPETKKITYQRGAAVCNFLLADEINRASPKAQSSLLEIMEEFQISLEGQTLPLPQPFMALATQNPIETYGTYHLPEAQMDRFLMRISMGYPSKEEEIALLQRMEGENPAKQLEPVLSLQEVIAMQQEVKKIRVHPLVQAYIYDIVEVSRNHDGIRLGVSPRGTIALQRAVRAWAYIHSRDYATPDDVRAVAPSVLAHRIILSQQGKNQYVSQEAVIDQVLRQVRAPMPKEGLFSG